jgi:23S rRNA (uridine2552-2'-O)-methyltransferase
MVGIAGVVIVQADLQTDEGIAAVHESLDGRKADLVLSDMAPNLSGIDSVDQARSVQLAELALEFACGVLQPAGDFVVKAFQGTGLSEFKRMVERQFSKVYLRKPKASRDRSRETFLVAKGLRRESTAD